MKILRTNRVIQVALVLLFSFSGMVAPTLYADCPVRAYTETWTTRVSPPLVVGQCYYACDGSVSCWGTTGDPYTSLSTTYHEFCEACDPE
jgi:hypothetical protein